MIPVLIAGVVALVASIAAVVAFRQARSLDRTLHSIARAAVVDVDGVELVKVVRDLARRADTAERSSAALRAAIEGAPTGVAILDPSGAVVYANKSAHRYLDETGDWSVLRTRVSSLGKQALAAGQVQQIEVDMHDPSRMVLLLTAVPIDLDEDAEIAATVHIEDLSARRRVDAMRADFVTNASHELKTPIGALSLLAETLAYTTDETKRSILADQLASEALRMTKVVDDILTLARTESMTTEYSPVVILDVLEEVAASLGDHAKANDIELIRGELVGATILGDHMELASALRNLLLNAITYTAAKGDDGGAVVYRSFVEGTMICIEIEDTGIGFPEKYARRIFERFFRVDHSRTRQSGGTGLGLSIVKNVAAAHGGSVVAASRLGEGSTFTMCLPIAQGDDT
jgi:two-component system sensor histidine kinase SenX3